MGVCTDGHGLAQSVCVCAAPAHTLVVAAWPASRGARVPPETTRNGRANTGRHHSRRFASRLCPLASPPPIPMQALVPTRAPVAARQSRAARCFVRAVAVSVGRGYRETVARTLPRARPRRFFSWLVLRSRPAAAPSPSQPQILAHDSQCDAVGGVWSVAGERGLRSPKQQLRENVCGSGEGVDAPLFAPPLRPTRSPPPRIPHPHRHPSVRPPPPPAVARPPPPRARRPRPCLPRRLRPRPPTRSTRWRR